MRILLFGSNGLIATAAGIFCCREGIELDVVGRSYPAFYGCRQYINADLKDVCPGDLENIDFNQYDVIIYAAAAGVQANDCQSASCIYGLNVVFPVELINLLAHNSFRGAVVTFGSYFEIGENFDDNEWDEKAVLSSVNRVPNDYCVSKRMLTRFAASCNVDFKYYHLILPTVYAEHESSQRLIPYTVANILRGKVGRYTSGNQVRQYVYADDLVRIIFGLVRAGAEAGIYNMLSGDTLTVKELVSQVYQIFGKHVPTGLFGTTNREDCGMKNLRLDSSKLRRVFDATEKVRRISEVLPTLYCEK